MLEFSTINVFTEYEWYSLPREQEEEREYWLLLVYQDI